MFCQLYFTVNPKNYYTSVGGGVISHEIAP
jgi:hypothetical protein